MSSAAPVSVLQTISPDQVLGKVSDFVENIINQQSLGMGRSMSDKIDIQSSLSMSELPQWFTTPAYDNDISKDDLLNRYLKVDSPSEKPASSSAASSPRDPMGSATDEVKETKVSRQKARAQRIIASLDRRDSTYAGSSFVESLLD